jgi:hypothetical protein
VKYYSSSSFYDDISSTNTTTTPFVQTIGRTVSINGIMNLGRRPLPQE